MDTSVIAVPLGAIDGQAPLDTEPRGAARGPLWEHMTVRTSLWLAFASVLLGAIVIGVFSLFQMGRLNQSTQVIYEQEFAAGQAAEQARGLILRASRAQTQLLTATTAAERDTLGSDIEASLAEVAKRLATIIALSASEQSAAPVVAASAAATGEAAHKPLRCQARVSNCRRRWTVGPSGNAPTSPW